MMMLFQNITEELHSNRSAIDALHEQASNLGEQVHIVCSFCNFLVVSLSAFLL